MQITLSKRINELVVRRSWSRDLPTDFQIAMSVEERTGGIFSFQHGTLYPILHRLEADGQLRGEWSGDGRRRKTYRITAAGQTTLREGAEDLERQAVLLAAGTNAA